MVIVGVVDSLGSENHVVLVVFGCQLPKAVPVTGVEGTFGEVARGFSFFATQHAVSDREFLQNVFILKQMPS